MRRTILTSLILLALLLVPVVSARAYVYWSDGGGDGSIGRADLSGAPVPGGGWIDSEGEGCGVAVDASHVYWTTRAGTIGRAGLDGSGVDPDFIVLPSGWACGVAVDADHLYWASNSSGKLGRAALDGSSVEAGWMSPGVGHGCGIDVNSSHLFWATASGVYSAPLAGGPTTTISTATSDNCGVAVNAVHIYWATGDGYIERDLLGGGPPTPIVKAPQSPCGVAVDSRYVYWGNSASDSVSRSNLDGSGVVRRFAEGATNPCGVAVDSLAAAATPKSNGVLPPPPSNVFRLGQVRKNKKRGTARLEVLLPGPGTVTLAGRRVRERSVVREDLAAGAGLTPVEIPVRPRRKTRTALKTFGIAIAPLSVTYQPVGGAPRTRYTRIWLRFYPSG
ncbi:MAG TPA: hypothetical protein VFI03_05315 [Solirubrobacterales bacterium]|nr:hypothetical protein [Solirubrobacterales bacterium]